MPQSIRLFVKPGCPWCRDAIAWLNAKGLQYETIDVLSDPKGMDEMRALTGQTLAPSIDVDGEILADFGVDEIEAWWPKFE